MNRIRQILIKYGYHEGYLTSMRGRGFVHLEKFSDIDSYINRRIKSIAEDGMPQYAIVYLQMSIELHIAHIMDKHCK